MNITRLIKLTILWCGSIIHRNQKSKILFYHDFYTGKGYVAPDCGIVMGTPMDLFRRHLEIIQKEGYKIVPKISHKEKEVAIMLDDGFRGIYENRQFFYDNDIFPSIFLAHDLIGKPGFLTIEEIRELQNHGFRFECHGWTHTNLTNKTNKELEQELGDSKNYLSSILDKEVTELCLPIGYFSNHLLDKIKEYGYNTIYSSIPGNYYDKIHTSLTPRILCQFASPQEVKLFLRGGGELIRPHYKKKHFLAD